MTLRKKSLSCAAAWFERNTKLKTRKNTKQQRKGQNKPTSHKHMNDDSLFNQFFCLECCNCWENTFRWSSDCLFLRISYFKFAFTDLWSILLLSGNVIVIGEFLRSFFLRQRYCHWEWEFRSFSHVNVIVIGNVRMSFWSRSGCWYWHRWKYDQVAYCFVWHLPPSWRSIKVFAPHELKWIGFI